MNISKFTVSPKPRLSILFTKIPEKNNRLNPLSVTTGLWSFLVTFVRNGGEHKILSETVGQKRNDSTSIWILGYEISGYMVCVAFIVSFYELQSGS